VGGGRACQGVGIGIVMHIKRRQRCGAARVQVDITFLTACRIDFFYLRSIECTPEEKRRKKNDTFQSERGNNIQYVRETTSNSLYTRFKSTTAYVDILCRSWEHDRTTNFKMLMRDEKDRINKFIVGIQGATHTT